METLRAKVDRVAFPAPSAADTEKGNVWYIILTDKGACKGEMFWRPKEGERLKFEGSWGAYKGRKEFQFSAAMQDIPVNPRDQLRLVAERTVGIGQRMEEAIWLEWGDAWITDVRPHVIPRLNGSVYEALRDGIDSFVIDKEKCEAIAWMMGKGGTLALATAAWDQWEREAISVVNNDCYELANLPNFGFKSVDDSIRHAFGITDQDPRRVKAAVVYAMKQLTGQGSTIVTWQELKNHAVEVLRGMYVRLISDAVKEMFGTGVLRAFPDTQSVSLGQDYENELAIWSFVNDC